MEPLVRKILDRLFELESELFLVDLAINAVSKSIRVVIDGDRAVSLQDCIRLNKGLEEALQESDSTLNFSLEVSSAGLSEPIKIKRQYKRRLGRDFEVLTVAGEKFTAKLMEAQPDFLLLELKAPKSKGKSAPKEATRKELPYEEIKEIRQKIDFKKLTGENNK